MKLLAIVAVMTAIASLASAQGSQAVVHQTLTSVVVVDLFPAVSTSTAYLTSLVTILGCPPWEKECPVRHNSVAVVTLNTAVSTTVCPLTLTSSRVSSYATTVISTSAPSFTQELSTTTTTWPTSGTRPSSYSPYSIPSSVWDSVSGISLGEPSGPQAGTKGDPAPTSLGSEFLDPTAASVDSSALSSLSSAVAGGSSATSVDSSAGVEAVTSSVGPGSASPAPTGSASPALISSAAIAPSTGSSPGTTSVPASASSASSASIGTSGLLRPATDSFGNTLSTIVSAHTDITTISGPSGVTVSISTGSVTIIAPANNTSVIRNFLAVTYSANSSTVTFPNVTYFPSATANSTANGTMATSKPTSLWTNSGTAAPVNMFSICLAIVALVLVL